MCITAYSLAMGCIWGSVLTVIMRAVQKSKWTLQYFGVKNLFVLYAFCIIRMTVAIELPVTKVVPIATIYNVITHLCRITVGGMVSIGYLFLVIWCCGAVLKLLWLLRDYQSTKQMLRFCTVIGEGMAYEMLEKLQSEAGDKKKIKIYRTPFDVPMEIGILQSAILLPDKVYGKQDLFYIMKHEYTHILNHDAMVKLLLNLWSCIFWWNPIAYLLNVNIEDILELKCDLKVAGELTREEKAAYLSAILGVIQDTVEKRREVPHIGYDGEKIKKRFQCISNCPETTGKTGIMHKGYMTAAITIYIIVFCISYSVVFQSEFDAPMEEMATEDNVVILEPETVYLQEREGRYEVIYENQCISIIDENTALLMKEDGFEIVR